MKNSSNNLITNPPFTAETLFVSLLEAGLDTEQIKVQHNGSFKRRYSQDVEMVEIDECDNKSKALISLNRDGLYDVLPEGLFHQTKGSSRVNSVEGAVEEHKQYKEEEKFARKFFAPLEQMLFLYKAMAENAERNILRDLQNGKLNSSFYEFWNISVNLPTAPAARLLRLMPYASLIKGDRENTEAALSYLLGKPVCITVNEQIQTEVFTDTRRLIDMRLGVDTVIGASCREVQVIWNCTINDILHSELEAFAPDMAMYNILNRFTEIFIPLDVELRFDFLPANQSLEETYSNVLGVGCYL